MKFLIPISITLILLSSCGAIYQPTIANVPLHDKAGDLCIGAYYGVGGVEAQASGALTDFLFLNLNGQYAVSKTKEDSSASHRTADIALGYYTKMGWADNLTFEACAGYGVADTRYRYLINTVPMQVRFHAESNYHKFYIQPTLGYRNDESETAITMRAVFLKYFNYKDHYNPNVPADLNIPIVAYLEPVVTVKYGVKNLKLCGQFGVQWPLTPYSFLARNQVSGFASIGLQVAFNVAKQDKKI